MCERDGRVGERQHDGGVLRQAQGLLAVIVHAHAIGAGTAGMTGRLPFWTF
jgi:hypothetical protein